jgi:hypothetical protein
MQEIWHHASLHHKLKKSDAQREMLDKKLCIDHWSEY